jgi:hypothetical protein
MVFDLEGQIAGHEVQQAVSADVRRAEHLTQIPLAGGDLPGIESSEFVVVLLIPDMHGPNRSRLMLSPFTRAHIDRAEHVNARIKPQGQTSS